MLYLRVQFRSETVWIKAGWTSSLQWISFAHTIPVQQRCLEWLIRAVDCSAFSWELFLLCPWLHRSILYISLMSIYLALFFLFTLISSLSFQLCCSWWKSFICHSNHLCSHSSLPLQKALRWFHGLIYLYKYHTDCMLNMHVISILSAPLCEVILSILPYT